jgi:hypothetical protein
MFNDRAPNGKRGVIKSQFWDNICQFISHPARPTREKPRAARALSPVAPLPRPVAPCLNSPMKTDALHIGLKVRHSQYGVGVVKAISETTAEIQFEDARRTIAPETAGLENADPRIDISGLGVPLKQFVEETLAEAIRQLGLEKPDGIVEQLGSRWHNGKVVLHPGDAALQSKEIPLEVFFHKVVGIRNQLRVLEQKINAHEKLSDAEKVEMQQYITRCYGSLTTFNVLFKNKQDQFSSKGE